MVAFSVPKTEHEVVRVQQDKEPHFYDQLHQHPEIQIMLIESGEGTLIAGDYVGRFGPGDVYVLGSGQPHVFRSDPAYYAKPSALAARSISLYFDENYFGRELWASNEFASVRELSESGRQGFQFKPEVSVQAASLIRTLSSQSGLSRLITFFTLLHLLINPAGRKKLALLHGRLLEHEEGRMNTIVEFTFRESHRKIYLKEVAQLANLSVEAFCRYFKMHTRKTYINFLNEVRISQACQLLIHRDMPVEQVCYQSGFANVSNFNRIFKKITRKTPLGFRGQVI